VKITGVEAIPVKVDRKLAYGLAGRTALGVDPVSEHAILRIDTDAGLSGWGEVASCFARRGRLYAKEIREILTPVLLGQDPTRIAWLNQQMDKALDGSEPAKAGIEMALFDLLGKKLGAPVYMLLGGLVRERIPLSRSITFGTPEQMAEAAKGFAAEGFGTVKVKVGQSFEVDVAAVAAVRKAVGDKVKVRVDANMAWRTPKEAAQIIKAMAPSRPELIEQPLRPRELDALAELRLLVDVPIMADESVWNPRDAMEVIRRKAVDIVNVYVCEAGGLMAATRIFQMCESAGIPCMIGSMPELGLGTAAQIHLGVAMTNLGLDSDACGVVYQQADLLKTPLRIEKGYAYPPNGPGLGVEVDLDAVARHRIPD
jgi:L-alanine-DL-glutamate epimerase-like enolase superfamily enzyme